VTERFAKHADDDVDDDVEGNVDLDLAGLTYTVTADIVVAGFPTRSS
jgi:hypothetical protein